MNRLRTIGLAGSLALMVAACSSGPASSPSASATPPSVAATASAAASGSEVALPSFELPNNAPELAALLPTKIGDVPMQTSSQTGADFMSGGDVQNSKEFVDFLNRMGAQPDDVSVAFALPDFTADPQLATDPTAYSLIFAFRVAGADSGKLLGEMKTALATDSADPVTWSAQSVGGKQVQVGSITSTDSEPQMTYLYAVQDIVFAVVSGSADSAAEALSALP